VALHEGQAGRALVRQLTIRSQRREGINDLLELDLYEIGIAPHPANPHTQILKTKTMAVEQGSLRHRCDEVAPEAALGWQPIPAFVQPEAKSGPTDAEPSEQAKTLGLPVPVPRRHPSYTAVRVQARRDMLTLFEQADGR
jgi:hypothetical protein